MSIKNKKDIILYIIFGIIKVQINLMIFTYFIPSLLDGIFISIFKWYIIQNIIYQIVVQINLMAMTYKQPNLISQILLLNSYFTIHGNQKKKLEENHFPTLYLFQLSSSIDSLQEFPIIIVKQLYFKFKEI